MKHNTTDEKIEKLEHDVADNTKEISDIRIVSAARSKEIENICNAVREQSKRMDKLIDQNRALLISILLMLGGMAIYLIEYAITHKP